jgi:hypothetical protein
MHFKKGNKIVTRAMDKMSQTSWFYFNKKKLMITNGLNFKKIMVTWKKYFCKMKHIM